jgi:predicted nucleic acid-binding protein
MHADRIFLDSNVMIYAYVAQDEQKQRISRQLIGLNSFVSTQVLQELANILRRKVGADFSTIRLLLQECKRNCDLHINHSDTIFSALDIAERYGFSFYDSLIVVSAMECKCSVLYSEDMQHNQQIETLIIKNPFLQE